MNDRQKRLKSIQSQLLQIYEDLFGVKYKSTGDVDEGTQFKAILQRFREKHFFIRQMQKDRQKKQKKGGQLAQQLLKNEKIRQELKMCQNLLKEAQTRIKNGIKHEDKSIGDKTLKSRKLMLDECYEMLNNLRTVQYGDSFEPKKKHQTLDQFKKRLFKEEINEVNLQQEQALQRFHRKDEDIEGLVTQIRNVDNTVKNNLRTANQKIGLSQQMIANNLQLANKVDVKIQKGTTDLRQVLKHYRRPSKLCLDVILVCLLLALVGVIINMLKGSL